MPASGSSTRVGWAALALFVVFSTALGRAFTAVTPGRHDASLYAYMGDRWLLGDTPYVDVWDNKPPGIFAVSALGRWLTPDSFVALAVFEGIVVLGCIAAVGLLVRRIGAPPWAAGFATAACAVLANLTVYN